MDAERVSTARARGAVWPLLFILLGALAGACARTEPSPAVTEVLADELELAVPNDNRSQTGTRREGVLELDLEARLARWKGQKSDLTPGAPDPSIVTVLGFAEQGGPVTIPGPLIRVPEGTEVRVRVRNSIPDSVSIGLPGPALREEGMSSVADPVLVVRGLRAGTEADDTLRIEQGQVGEVRYRATEPGTYFYWATPSTRSLRTWTGRDAQLTGAIVVDPGGGKGRRRPAGSSAARGRGRGSHQHRRDVRLPVAAARARRRHPGGPLREVSRA